VKLDGDSFVIEVQATRNARGENTLISDVLPDSGVASFKKGSLTAARYFQPLQIDNELIKLASRDAATFSTRVEILYRDAKNQMQREINRQVTGKGNGVIATVGAAFSTASQTSAQLTVDSTKFLEEGMMVDIWVASGTTQRNTVTLEVSSIDSDTLVTVKTIGGTTYVPTTIINTDIMTKKGALYVSGGTRYCKEFNGLQQFTTGNDSFMGIDGSTVRTWRPNRYNASSAAFSPLIAGKALVQGRRAVKTLEEDKPDVIYASPEQTVTMVYGANAMDTRNNVRFSRDEATKVGYSFDTPTVNFGWGDIKVNSDLDLPTTSVFAFNRDALIYGELSPLALEEWDGVSVLPAMDSGVNGGIIAAQRMWFGWRMNLGCRRRNAFTEIYGLTVA
jgi:hypothetical protein